MRLELTFGNDHTHLPSVRAFVAATLRQLSLKEAVVETLERFIDESAQDAMERAYPAGEQGLIKLSIEAEHGKLEIRVRDYGIPQDVNLLERQLRQSVATEADRGGSLAVAHVADEVHWLSFGPEGKALQVVKWLHEKHITDVADDAALRPFSSSVPPAPEQHYEVRRMRAGESEQVSQLMLCPARTGTIASRVVAAPH